MVLTLPPGGPPGHRPQSQSIQLDETLGVSLVVSPLVLLEGGDGLVEEGVVGLPPYDLDVALVEPYPDPAIHPGLRVVDGHLEHFPFGAEPEAVVNQLGVPGHQLVLEVGHAPVQGDRLHGPVGLKQDGPAGGLVGAP